MKIVACLAWYDEPIDFLYRCVDSLAGAVDGLVAYDGPWALYPSDTPQSPPEQTQAILEAWGRGTDLWVSRSAGPWSSQIAKRDALMQHGLAIGGDWLLVVDGDEWIETCNRPALDLALDGTERDVARVGLTDTRHSNRGAPVRRLYRALPGLGVAIAHNGYCVETSDGRRWLHGDPAFVHLEPALDVSPDLRLRHEHRARGERRNAASHTYRWERRRARAERWPRIP